MEPAGHLLDLGLLFLLGLAADRLGRGTAVPRIAVLIAAGMLVGPAGFDLLGGFDAEWNVAVTEIALVMVGFLVGGTLEGDVLRRYGRTMLVSSAGVTVATFIIVTLGILLMGLDLAPALILGAVATATDPAATLDAIHEARASGRLTTTVRGVVALDDAWGVVMFTLALTVARLVSGDADVGAALLAGVYELAGAIALGGGLGLPFAWLTGRIEAGEPTQAEALGMVLVCGGVADWLGVSPILAAMIMGVVVVNRARHHRRPFHAIEGIEWPFLIVFFVLCGASLALDAALEAGVLLFAYVVLRLVGRLVGGYLSAPLAHLQPRQGALLGLALLPQASIALGMILVAREVLGPSLDELLPVVVGATVAMEMIGPVLTRWSLGRAGETGALRAAQENHGVGSKH